MELGHSKTNAGYLMEELAAKQPLSIAFLRHYLVPANYSHKASRRRRQASGAGLEDSGSSLHNSDNFSHKISAVAPSTPQKSGDSNGSRRSSVSEDNFDKYTSVMHCFM